MTIANKRAPGDNLVMEMAVHSLMETYPDYRVSITSNFSEIFKNHPYLSHSPSCRAIEIDFVGFIGSSKKHGINYARSYCVALQDALKVPLELTCNRPHIYLSAEELQPIIEPPYIVISTGTKPDIPLKKWNKWKQLVKQIRSKIKVVQVGIEGTEPIEGCINLIGQTNLRQLFQVCHKAKAGIGGISLLQHVMAAFQLPYICIAGGREPINWICHYPQQHTLHTMGFLPCCGCLRKMDCVDMVGDIAHCMDLISVEQVMMILESLRKAER